jgi:hypothetical protein
VTPSPYALCLLSFAWGVGCGVLLGVAGVLWLGVKVLTHGVDRG